MEPLNVAIKYTETQEVIKKLGKVLTRIIDSVSEAPEDCGQIFFRKSDIKEGFWIMLCQAEHNGIYLMYFQRVLMNNKPWWCQAHQKWSGNNHQITSAQQFKWQGIRKNITVICWR